MPRIAVISDIHGNVAALDAVLDDLRDAAPDEVLVGGDLVGRGPEGRAVVRAIASSGWRGVRGNHEDYLLNFVRRSVPEDWLEIDEWAASRWMAAELGADDIDYIDALPMALSAQSDPRLVLTHGTPRANNEGIGPWTHDDDLERHVSELPGRVFVCGHTHRAMVRPSGGTLVVNAGSVGLPFDGDRRAAYALIDIDGDAVSAQIRRVDYPVGNTLAAYNRTGFLAAGGATSQMLSLELEYARPHLVPFITWCAQHDYRAVPEHIGAFLAVWHARIGLDPAAGRD
jgi:predicted phosphodiesterase